MNVIEFSPIPDKVYHYTKLSIGLEKILYEEEFVLGSLGNTSDPKETKHKPFAFMFERHEDWNPEESVQETSKLDAEINRMLNEEFYFISFSVNDADLKPSDHSRVDRPHKYGYARPRLWAHFGENHEGLCLEFDGPKLHRELVSLFGEHSNISHGNVEYINLVGAAKMLYLDDLRRVGARAYMKEFINDNAKEFFFTKVMDFETENEYRWVINSPANKKISFNISTSISGVIAGVDFPKTYRPSLEALCKNHGILGTQMTWDNNTPVAQMGNLYKP